MAVLSKRGALKATGTSFTGVVPFISTMTCSSSTGVLLQGGFSMLRSMSTATGKCFTGLIPCNATKTCSSPAGVLPEGGGGGGGHNFSMNFKVHAHAKGRRNKVGCGVGHDPCVLFGVAIGCRG